MVGGPRYAAWVDLMLALTLWPEWAFAIAYLGKRIENRTWKRDSLIDEVIAIHGGRYPGGQSDSSCWGDEIRSMLEVARSAGAALPDPITIRGVLALAQQKVVAVARVAGFVSSAESAWFCGPWGWQLEDVRVLPDPLPCRGSQGLWTLPDDLWVQVDAQLRLDRGVGGANLSRRLLDVSNKVAHVRREAARGPTGNHPCHAIGCPKHIPPAYLMCAEHWRMVPADLQRQIWRTYRAGQEIDKRPSGAYLEAQRAAVLAVARKEGRHG